MIGMNSNRSIFVYDGHCSYCPLPPPPSLQWARRPWQINIFCCSFVVFVFVFWELMMGISKGCFWESLGTNLQVGGQYYEQQRNSCWRGDSALGNSKQCLWKAAPESVERAWCDNCTPKLQWIVQWSSGVHLYMPTALCAQGPICPRLCMPKVLCVQGSMCPGFYMPTKVWAYRTLGI